MTTSPVYIFLDANAVLHFERADQIDWCGLAGATDVISIIAPILLRELEKQKVHNPLRKLRDRAADAVKWLAGLIDIDTPVPLRPGVTLQFLPHEARLDFAALRLSESLSDDHLIANALEFRDHSGGHVLVATADIGMRVKLRAYDLRTVVIPEAFRLPAELDATEKELRHLRQEVARLQSRQPKLALLFKSGEQRLTLPRRSRSASAVEDEFARVQFEHPYMRHANENPLSPLGFPDLPSLFGSIGADPATIDRYNAELDKFYAEYSSYLGRVQPLRDEALLTYQLEFQLENQGAAPATDIDAVLTFPDDLRLAKVDDLPKLPDPPEPPTRPNFLGELFNFRTFGPPVDIASRFPAFYQRDYDSNGKPIIDQSRRSVRFPQRALKHGFVAQFTPVCLVFSSPATFRSLAIDVEISAAELPHPVRHKLHVIVEDELSN